MNKAHKPIKFTFGKHSGKLISELDDYKYFIWLVESDKFDLESRSKREADSIIDKYNELKELKENNQKLKEIELNKLLKCKRLSELDKLQLISSGGNYVYIIRNIPLDKSYIGQTGNLTRRMLNYYECDEMGVNRALKKDIMDYGRSNFELTFIECDNNKKEEKELEIIQEYEKEGKNLYNIARRKKYI
jgi:hypothetical protein